VVGFSLSALLFIHRMSHSVQVEGVGVPPQDDSSDDDRESARTAIYHQVSGRNVVIYRITGAFFFGAAAAVAAALDRIAERPGFFVLDFEGVAVMDSTAATTINAFVRKQRARGARVFIAGASDAVRQELVTHGAGEPEIRFLADVTTALRECRADDEAQTSLT
jgi:SulP family sulfate permease